MALTILLFLAAIASLGLAWLTTNILIPKLLVFLAKRDEWWSPLRLLPPSGEMFFIVRGSPEGPFDRLLESVPDYEWSNSEHKFKKLDGEDARKSESFLSSYGIGWVGFFRNLFKREVVHMKYVQRPDGSWTLDSKVRPGPAVFFRWNMATLIQEAEIDGNIAVDAVMVYTVQLTDPVRALFFAGNWEKQVAAAVQGKFRKYAANKSFETLLNEQKSEEGKKQPVSKEIIDLNAKGPGGQKANGLLELFGVEILDARFVKVDVVGSAEAREAMQALEIADRRAQAAKREGEGERDRRAAIAEGIRAEMRAYNEHPDSAQIAMAEAIKVAKPNVIGAGVIVSAESKRKVELAE